MVAMSSIGLAGLVLADTSTEPVNVKITRAVVINGNADASSLGVAPSALAIGVTGANNVDSIGVALRFQFVDKITGAPVNVTNFTFSSATYTLINTGAATTWTNVADGAYNPAGDTSVPDMVSYDMAGAKVSADGQQIVGTTIPIMSKFELTNQLITLGAARPKFSASGQYYRLERTLGLSYTYGGQSYTHTIAPSDSFVQVTVQPDMVGFSSGGSVGPFQIRLMASVDLQNWVPVPVNGPIPYPLPIDPKVVIAMAPTVIPGLTVNGKLFLRFQEG